MSANDWNDFFSSNDFGLGNNKELILGILALTVSLDTMISDDSKSISNNFELYRRMRKTLFENFIKVDPDIFELIFNIARGRTNNLILLNESFKINNENKTTRLFKSE